MYTVLLNDIFDQDERIDILMTIKNTVKVLHVARQISRGCKMEMGVMSYNGYNLGKLFVEDVLGCGLKRRYSPSLP